MRVIFYALIVLLPSDGGFYSNRSYFGGRGVFPMQSLRMVFICGFNHGYH